MKTRVLILAAALSLPALPYAGAQDWASLPCSAAGIDASVPVPSAAPIPLERALPVVCVDAGHPNTFNAATDVQNGTSEVHINWQVAVKLQRILKEKGFGVLMTKNAEMQYVENKDRGLACNAAALAVHLHCESTPGSGFALYYPARVGTFEYHNDPDNGFKGPSPQVMTGSKALAEAMSAGMRATLAGELPQRGVYDESHTAVGESQGALTFSIFSKVPTITIEMVVLSNKKDAAYIKADAWQEKMAQAIAAGIAAYAGR
jgi:N-acetylmuramoyl-L-alanine amidase